MFTVKAFKSLTHERQDGVAVDAGKFRFSLAPLIEAGKLGAVPLQFPYSFRCCQENRSYLARLGEMLGDLPLATEFRHAGWESEAVWEFLKSLHMAYVAVDEPQLRGLVGGSTALTTNFGYVRFMGATPGAGGSTSRPTSATTTYTGNQNCRNGSPAFITWPREWIASS
jgi:uncharacterized protein YecE (DUF72 family)